MIDNSGKNDTSDIGEQDLNYEKVSNDLVKGIQNQEFVVHYQPQVEISTGEIVGAEALVRWNSPDGLIYPADFISIAEEKGHILEIGRQVLLQSCKAMKKWLDSGYTLNNISVNLSVKQIHDDNFIQTVKEVLLESELDPHYLEFEVTERILMQEYETVFNTLDTLRTLGITLSIDAFGRGDTSIASLKKLPMNKIKIDRSFIEDITTDENDLESTKTIIAMSHSLNLKVLAEGVEYISQLAIVEDLKCEKYQGFHFSEPVPVDMFEELLEMYNR